MPLGIIRTRPSRTAHARSSAEKHCQAIPETLEAWAYFHAAIEDLDEPECEVFSLVWYGGLPQKEIAGLLNVSVPTVQRRWYRAQVQLYEALQGQSPEAHDDS